MPPTHEPLAIIMLVEETCKPTSLLEYRVSSYVIFFF